ncbi:TonB-dependent receptor domain-containing protein [Salinimonas lutimaris]|uniref:TonB-dependent receptor domain-containing protein n=1 Tax=Salinimonas lutimaris TaxID=914153 RepID=UPI0010C0B0A5|nr:TonB-dependent receptor [Salinimonas lutimaris]
MTHINKLNMLTAAVAVALSQQAVASTAPASEQTIEEVTVVGRSVSYANNAVSSEMVQQQSAMTSALSVIDNLPGVMINEGDTFGSDDWSTTVSIRGFQLSLDEQQIGITIDGIANGNSNYGGGSKANRYIDTENLGTVEVSQGTADVASRSNEALGGTLNFTTMDPGSDERLTFSITQGDFEAQKYFVRYETGEIAPETYAWISASTSSNTDWIQEVADNEHDHLAAKVISRIGKLDLTAYASYDDAVEANYQRVSLEQFEQDPTWDRLIGQVTDVPYINQVYRNGWQTHRENTFAYLQGEYALDNLDLSANVYYHHNEGNGDWVPPYVVDVNDDGSSPNTELQSGTTYYGGEALGRLYYVDAQGNALTPQAGCESSLTFPYGGAGAEYDPACYANGAVPVASYRHTHYGKDRVGINADFSWYTQIGEFDNTLRGGFWYEDYEREEYRDWHRQIEPRVSANFDNSPYWVQYSREFTVDTTMFYLEDEIDLGMARLRVGAKKFLVDLEARDVFGERDTVSVDSDSDTLLSAGIVVPLFENLEVFAGYAENFAAIKDTVLERDASALESVEPETADNIDVGLRYSSSLFSASITYYDITFDNRLTFIAPDSPDGIDFLIGTSGQFVNVGGIESDGIEASATWYVNSNWSLYGSYTYNDSTYTGDLDSFPNGNTVFGSAEDLFVLSANWAKDNYFAGLSGKYVGERFMDALNTQRVDAYTAVDFYAGVALQAPFDGVQDLELRLTINNLTDESYIGGIAGQSGWIGAPRTAAANLKFSF